MPVMGVPKEIKTLEKRVGLVPSAVKYLTGNGVRVFIETGAGSASGFTDLAYEEAGAGILPNAAALYSRCDIIQKVKEPLPPEYPLLREGQILFGFLHLASPENCGLVSALKKSRVTAIAYETVELNGRLPILAPMSEIAGGLSAAYAAYIRKHAFEIKNGSVKYPQGFLEGLYEVAARFPQLPDLQLGTVMIFGGGIAGTRALEVGLALGGEILVIEKNAERRNELERKGARTAAPDSDWSTVLDRADVLIGCVHVRGQRAFRVLTAEQLLGASRGKKKIIMDISIDQGGNFPESRSSSYSDPLYFDSCGNIRFGVANIPSLSGAAASTALSNETVNYALALGKGGQRALAEFPELMSAVNVDCGEIRIKGIEIAHERKS